jgi:hypothetical protein
VRKLGDGSNALVYLAKCRVGGRLHAHTDALVVLKVLVHYRQEGVAGDLTRSSSALNRTFLKEVEREARGPDIPEFRDNLVHVLGTFFDDAAGLAEYAALDADLVDPRTAFLIIPYFAGGDLKALLRAHKRAGTRLAEETVLDYLCQMLHAVQKVGQCDNAHRDLKPDNIFFTGARESLALADFGEVGGRRLEFTKGVTSPGGSPACLAPEVLAAIGQLAEGQAALIDYTKNDIFAVGLIAYAMCHADPDAAPWREGSPRDAAHMARLDDARHSAGLRDLIEQVIFRRAGPICAWPSILTDNRSLSEAWASSTIWAGDLGGAGPARAHVRGADGAGAGVRALPGPAARRGRRRRARAASLRRAARGAGSAAGAAGPARSAAGTAARVAGGRRGRRHRGADVGGAHCVGHGRRRGVHGDLRRVSARRSSRFVRRRHFVRARRLSPPRRPSRREAQASASAQAALAPGCDEALVAELVGWGFEEPAVRTALEAAGGDKQAAANMLLG